MGGGKSSRMMADIGKDKTLLPFGNFDNLVAFLHSRLISMFTESYVSAKSLKFGSEFDYCLDYEEICGIDINELFAPTISIYSSLSMLGYEKVLFVPADMPFVSAKTLASLVDADDDKCDAIVLRLGEKIYPTCALYKRTALRQLGQNISNNKHKLTLFLDEINTIFVEAQDENELININNHEEYKKAQESLK
jgi:molybdopterin-guanine dinucleotide biosynthesis protein A